MLLPANAALPFFSYGIFRPGELAHFRIRRFVERASPASVRGELRLRDGLLIGCPGGGGRIEGVLLTFSTLTARDAYSYCVTKSS